MSYFEIKIRFPFCILILFTLVGCVSKPLYFEGKNPQSYAEVERRIAALKAGSVEVIGTVPGTTRLYPLYLITYPGKIKGDSSKRQNVLLSGGAHGDEPAGVYALLDFLEKEAPKYVKDFRFYIFPCLNPSGFEGNHAKTIHAENVNRQFFDKTQNPEALLVINALAKRKVRFAFTIDMHEIPPYWEDEGFKQADNPHSAYLYETQTDIKKRIGPKMMEELPAGTEVCQWKTIYGDKAVNGVVTYPEGNGNAVYAQGTTFDAYLFRLYTEHSFTNETPIVWPMEKRVQTQLSWLRTALKLFAIMR